MPKNQGYGKKRNFLGKMWHFIWHGDSIWSWIVDVILAVLIVKLLIYPGLGLVLGTDRPVVAVVSNSMEHNEDFEKWYDTRGRWYDDRFAKEEMDEWPLKNGFNKGDIVFLRRASNIEKGEIIVFWGTSSTPIIHRVVDIYERNGEIMYQTKGDNNLDSYPGLGELDIKGDKIIGKSLFKVPFVGWIKIWVSEGYSKIFR
ncbi:MAG: signal peptidase I [Nanoarchaeota archaeon]|nr:signal peptidase I [Nanoarchaeota archaeon]